MAAFLTQFTQQTPPKQHDAFIGRGVFVQTCNALSATGKAFVYDELNDKYLCDGREVTKGVIAELRLHCARESQRAPSSKTVNEVVKALCRLHRVCPIPDLAALPEAQPTRYPRLPYRQELQGIINKALIQDDREFLQIIQLYGRSFIFVALRDLKYELGVNGRGEETAQIRAAMQSLCWRPRHATLHGRSMPGFIYCPNGECG
jgi:hypothetical protein